MARLVAHGYFGQKALFHGQRDRRMYMPRLKPWVVTDKVPG
jgi:hypothetical protein